jgi:hypothetical protein
MALAASQQALAARVNVAGKQLSVKKSAAKATRVPRASIQAAAKTATVSVVSGKKLPKKKMKKRGGRGRKGARGALFFLPRVLRRDACLVLFGCKGLRRKRGRGYLSLPTLSFLFAYGSPAGLIRIASDLSA